MDTGMANIGMIVERQFCRKQKYHYRNQPSALIKRASTSCMDTLMMVTDSKGNL
jgi:hypothetical protein